MSRLRVVIPFAPMASRKRIVHEGREVDATMLDFSVIEDGVARYRLEDGTVLRVKPVVVNVLRLEGEKTELGEPVFLVQSLVHTTIEGSGDDGHDESAE